MKHLPVFKFRKNKSSDSRVLSIIEKIITIAILAPFFSLVAIGIAGIIYVIVSVALNFSEVVEAVESMAPDWPDYERKEVDAKVKKYKEMYNEWTSYPNEDKKALLQILTDFETTFPEKKRKDELRIGDAGCVFQPEQYDFVQARQTDVENVCRKLKELLDNGLVIHAQKYRSYDDDSERKELHNLSQSRRLVKALSIHAGLLIQEGRESEAVEIYLALIQYFLALAKTPDGYLMSIGMGGQKEMAHCLLHNARQFDEENFQNITQSLVQRPDLTSALYQMEIVDLIDGVYRLQDMAKKAQNNEKKNLSDRVNNFFMKLSGYIGGIINYIMMLPVRLFFQAHIYNGFQNSIDIIEKLEEFKNGAPIEIPLGLKARKAQLAFLSGGADLDWTERRISNLLEREHFIQTVINAVQSEHQYQKSGGEYPRKIPIDESRVIVIEKEKAYVEEIPDDERKAVEEVKK